MSEPTSVEREARRLAMNCFNRIAWVEPDPDEPVITEMAGELAKALEKCANEARLEEQTNYPAPHRHSASLQQDYERLVADCPRCKRIAELKRAVAGNDAAPTRVSVALTGTQVHAAVNAWACMEWGQTSRQLGWTATLTLMSWPSR